VRALVLDGVSPSKLTQSYGINKIMKHQSRSQRLSEALENIAATKTEVELLRDELQEWLDNMPENLQESMKASELEEAITTLEEIIGECEELEGREGDVMFPSMY